MTTPISVLSMIPNILTVKLLCIQAMYTYTAFSSKVI